MASLKEARSSSSAPRRHYYSGEVRQGAVLCSAGEVRPSRSDYRSMVLPRAADCLTRLLPALLAALADDKTSLSATLIAGGTNVTDSDVR